MPRAQKAEKFAHFFRKDRALPARDRLCDIRADALGLLELGDRSGKYALWRAEHLEQAAQTPAGALEYGAQRRLDVGIALSSGARTLLLDEPTAGMNRDEAQHTIEWLRGVTSGKTLLVIEHDMDVVFSLADRISVLVEGRVIASGTPAEIRADERVREAYLGAPVGTRQP